MLIEPFIPLISSTIGSTITYFAQEARYRYLRKKNDTNCQMQLKTEELEYIEQLRQELTKTFVEEREILRRTFETERNTLMARIAYLEQQETELRNRLTTLERECYNYHVQSQSLLSHKDNAIEVLNGRLEAYHQALLQSKQNELAIKQSYH